MLSQARCGSLQPHPHPQLTALKSRCLFFKEGIHKCRREQTGSQSQARPEADPTQQTGLRAPPGPHVASAATPALSQHVKMTRLTHLPAASRNAPTPAGGPEEADTGLLCHQTRGQPGVRGPRPAGPVNLQVGVRLPGWSPRAAVCEATGHAVALARPAPGREDRGPRSHAPRVAPQRHPDKFCPREGAGTPGAREAGPGKGAADGCRKPKQQPDPGRVCRETAPRKRASPASSRQRLRAHAADRGARAPRLGLPPPGPRGDDASPPGPGPGCPVLTSLALHPRQGRSPCPRARRLLPPHLPPAAFERTSALTTLLRLGPLPRDTPSATPAPACSQPRGGPHPRRHLTPPPQHPLSLL